MLLLVVLFFPQIRLGTFAALLLWDLLDETTVQAPERGALAWVTRFPSMETVKIPREKEPITADLYLPADGGEKAAILLTHGVIETGKDDPRLVRFARSLARTGFVVLVPDLKGMKSFRILMSDVDDIVSSFRYLTTLKGRVNETKIGLMGFSYAAGPTFLAAADPAIARQVKFVVSFGGYYDPINVIRFITTGYYEYGSERGHIKPEPYGKWVFFMNNLKYVKNETDRRLLKVIFEKEEKQKREEVLPLLGELTPRGRALYDLLVNEDPGRVEELVKKIDPRVRDYLEKLSMVPVIPKLHAYLLIGHGTTDPLIPYTESLRLAAAVKDKSKINLSILRLFAHVDPSKQRFSAKEYLTVYLPSMLKFYYLIYDLLSQQR